MDSHAPPTNPVSTPSSPIPPFLRLPPELLSRVVSSSIDPSFSYHQRKSSLARLCLVNHQLLPIAREQLYSQVSLFTRETNLDGSTWHDCQPHDTKLWDLMLRNKDLADLVKEVHVVRSSDKVHVIATVLDMFIVPLHNLRKLWFLGGSKAEGRPLSSKKEEEDEVEDQENGDAPEEKTKDAGEEKAGEKRGASESIAGGDDGEPGSEESEGDEETTSRPDNEVVSRDQQAVSELCQRLVKLHRDTLEILVTSTFPLQAPDFHILFALLENLRIYQGLVFEPPADATDLPASVAPLLRLWAMNRLTQPAFDFIRTSCSTSLRFLQFAMPGPESSISLGHLPSLEHLVISTGSSPQDMLLVGVPVVGGGGPILLNLGEIDYLQKELLNIVDTLKTLDSPELKIFGLDFQSESLNDSWTEYFDPLFSALPPSIVEFALGPVDSSALPPSSLVDQIHRYPSLERLRVITPKPKSTKDSTGTEDSSLLSTAWYDHPALSLNRSMDVVTISKREWVEWTTKEFYPEGSEEEVKPFGSAEKEEPEVEPEADEEGPGCSLM